MLKCLAEKILILQNITCDIRSQNGTVDVFGGLQ